MMASLLHDHPKSRWQRICVSLAYVVLPALMQASVHATETQGASPKTVPSAAGQASAKFPPKPSSVRWDQLTPAQQQALAPLSSEWTALSANQQQKWQRIADRYSLMKPEEQQRLQTQMKDWVKLTPEQRRIARENYRKIEKLHPEKKQEKWQAYQELPDEKKQALKTPPAVAKPPVAPPTGNVTRSSAAIPTLKSHKPPPKPEAIQKANQAPPQQTVTVIPPSNPPTTQ